MPDLTQVYSTLITPSSGRLKGRVSEGFESQQFLWSESKALSGQDAYCMRSFQTQFPGGNQDRRTEANPPHQDHTVIRPEIIKSDKLKTPLHTHPPRAPLFTTFNKGSQT